jgi:hypothetical protein
MAAEKSGKDDSNGAKAVAPVFETNQKNDQQLVDSQKLDSIGPSDKAKPIPIPNNQNPDQNPSLGTKLMVQPSSRSRRLPLKRWVRGYERKDGTMVPGRWEKVSESTLRFCFCFRFDVVHHSLPLF